MCSPWLMRVCGCLFTIFSVFFFSSRRRHTRYWRDWSSDVCSSDLDLVDTGVQTSPRVGLAYHFNQTKSVLHLAYNRYFSPPPIEYSLLASFIGHNAVDLSQRVGDVRAYTQNYFEVGWAQELHPQISLELNAYLHTGHNSFENHEISISRIFVPINFHTARSEGAELVLNMRQLESIGISGRFQYALSKTYFFGPINGGFAGYEP